MLREVAGRARRAAVEVDLHGCDVSPVALERARERRPKGVRLRFFRLDVLEEEIPGGYDLITCSLFLHHLDREEAVTVLRRAGGATERSLLIQDLRRTRLGWILAWTGARVLTRSDVVRVDGPRSVESAFTLGEAEELCGDAGLEDARVEAAWPQRFILRWRRAGA